MHMRGYKYARLDGSVGLNERYPSTKQLLLTSHPHRRLRQATWRSLSLYIHVYKCIRLSLCWAPRPSGRGSLRPFTTYHRSVLLLYT